MYGTALSQSIDSPRASDTAVPFEVSAGVIVDVIFDTAPYNWAFQNILGANADSPQSTTVYITVVNPSTSTGVGTTLVTFQFLPLET
jgi:hypothetical protein